MSEGTSLPSRDSFSSMKQWIKAKFKAEYEDETSITYRSSNQKSSKQSSGNSVPKIIISRGSDKNINRINSPANSPVFKRPSPLARTWSNYNDSPAHQSAPNSVPHNSTKAFWNPSSSISGLDENSQSSSVPCTPMQKMQTRPMRSAPTEIMTGKIRSPVFQFSMRNKLLIGDYENQTPYASTAFSRSELDSMSVCGACGQRKFNGSRDLVGFESANHLPQRELGMHSAVNSPVRRHKQLGLRRTSSCRAPENLERKIFNKSASIVKAASNLDVQKRSSSKRKKVRRTGSKETYSSTISLTRSWSINLETFRIVRNESLRSHDNDTARKMSLNDNELRRVNERRRSSLLRLLCYENTDSEKGEDTRQNDVGSMADSETELDIMEYSPKVTRATKFVNGAPVDDFKSTFESDDIKIPSIYGQVKVMFQFFNEKNEFQVTLLKGSNVAQGQTGTLGVYAKVCLMPGKIQKKMGDDKHNTTDPVFYEPFTFSMSLDKLLNCELRIKLYNKPGIFSLSEPIGECSIPLYHHDLTAVTVLWQNLKKSKGQKDDLDQFDFSPLERNQRKIGIRKLLNRLAHT